MLWIEGQLRPSLKHCFEALATLNHALRCLLVSSCSLLIAGCVSKHAATFTLTADLPPAFAYIALVHYVPEQGQNCTVSPKDRVNQKFNIKWRTEYKPNSQILIRKVVRGCTLVARKIDLEIRSAYGKDWGDMSGDQGMIVIRKELEDRYTPTFNEAGEHLVYGQCQWWFRTSGKPRILRKILDCTSSGPEGLRDVGKVFSAYTLDQLPGKTVRLVVGLDKEEKPGWGDTWVKVPNGWKRCMGRSYEDQRAYCNGNYTDFSTFKMVDGRVCTIYPGCTK